MSGNHSASRAQEYRIGDLNRDEVFDFLNKRGVSQDLHVKFYNVTGGRINHLKIMTSDFIDKRMTFDGKNVIIYIRC